jgi:ATP-dependent protease HslVU (ClpYQ) peptidase subunit
MTTIAAIQGNGWCAIGADSQASDDSGLSMDIVTGKIVTNGCAVIAAAGSVRGINILQFGWTAPRYVGKNPDYYMAKTFIPAMRKIFIESGYDMKDDGDVAQNDNDFIVAVRGVLYSVADDYSFERCKRGMYAIGTGGKYALGAMSLLLPEELDVDSAKRIIRRSIETAIYWDIYSGGDIQLVVQRG